MPKPLGLPLPNYTSQKNSLSENNVYKLHIEQLHLDLMQEKRPGAVTWWLYSTSMGYPTINIWGLGGPGTPMNRERVYGFRCQSKKGGGTLNSVCRAGN